MGKATNNFNAGWLISCAPKPAVFVCVLEIWFLIKITAKIYILPIAHHPLSGRASADSNHEADG